MIILTDIHGCYKTMLALLAQIPEEAKANGICIAGDLIDRAPYSAQVIEYVINNNIKVVRGNHEQLMLDEGLKCAAKLKEGRLSDLFYDSVWLPNGGDKTLYSYMDSNRNFNEELFIKHLNWINELPYILHFKDIKDSQGRSLVVSHSTCAEAFYKEPFKTTNLTDRQKTSILWGRKSVPKKLKNKFNVYGHTPNVKPQIREHYANIDTGCYLDGHYNMKYLTALDFPSMKIYQQECIDFNNDKDYNKLFGGLE